MSRATNDDMDRLHQVVAKVLTQLITNPGENGVPASLIKEAREFLKDNGVNAAVGKSSVINDLAAVLPFADEDTGT